MSLSMQTACSTLFGHSPRPTPYALLNLRAAFSMQETPLPDFVPRSYAIHLESNEPTPFI